MDSLPPGIVLVITLVCFVIAVLWLILPFAVFGIKSRLDHTNRLLVEVRDALKANAVAQPSVEELIARRRAAEAEQRL